MVKQPSGSHHAVVLQLSSSHQAGSCLAVVWHSLSRRQVNVRQLTLSHVTRHQSPGSHQAVVRQSLGSHAVVRQSPGSRQTVIRQSFGSSQAVLRQLSELSGSCQAVARQSSGSRLAVVRQPSGSCQAAIRQLSGNHVSHVIKLSFFHSFAAH